MLVSVFCATRQNGLVGLTVEPVGRRTSVGKFNDHVDVSERVPFLVGDFATTRKKASIKGRDGCSPYSFMNRSGFVTVTSLPDSLQTFVQFLPMTHVIELLQAVWFDRGWPLPATGALLVTSVVSGTIAVRSFRWD